MELPRSLLKFYWNASVVSLVYLHQICIMIFKKILSSLLFIALAAEVWSHVEIESEDYFFPLEPVINYCKLSDQCQHDFVPICGQDSLGITRLFSDNCDLFEYNCDEKKQYRHVKMKVCQYEAVASDDKLPKK